MRGGRGRQIVRVQDGEALALGGGGQDAGARLVNRPSRHGVEPSEEVIERNAAIYRSRLPNARVSVIARVGYDVAASCGMFFGPQGPSADTIPVSSQRPGKV